MGTYLNRAELLSKEPTLAEVPEWAMSLIICAAADHAVEDMADSLEAENAKSKAEWAWMGQQFMQDWEKLLEEALDAKYGQACGVMRAFGYPMHKVFAKHLASQGLQRPKGV